MSDRFSRTELLLGKTAMEHLSGCRIAVFGIGGVGGYVCEALGRRHVSPSPGAGPWSPQLALSPLQA